MDIVTAFYVLAVFWGLVALVAARFLWVYLKRRDQLADNTAHGDWPALPFGFHKGSGSW